MKIRLTFLASIAIALALALVGVLKDANPTRAIIDNPVIPFAAESKGGISTNKLGDSIGQNFTVTEAERGERVTLPWIYSGAGFSVDRDADYTDGTQVGTVWSNIDVGCDGTVDFMMDPSFCASLDPAAHPLKWYERTTSVAATTEAYLLKVMPGPPFTWLLRHRADITNVCADGIAVPSVSELNTVYANVPFSPLSFSNKQAFVAQTLLGGSPTTPPSKICLDSPQSSSSQTWVYNNPPALTDGIDPGTLDDGSGLYPRWTIFQSLGSNSLQMAGDLRKNYASPPSLPSDIGYVERIVQVECFWIDGNGCDAANGDCDADDNGYISPEESWNDPDLLALTGKLTGALAKADIDEDGDCLMNSDHTQGSWPAVDAVDDPDGVGIVSCDTNPNWVTYSEQPNVVHHNTANDQDCDGLLDGIEWFWGGNARVTSADGDNDGAPDFVEMFMFTSPIVADTDGDTFADKPSSVYGTNTDPTVDNCPSKTNNPQTNSDGARRPTGSRVPGVVEGGASNPSTDKMGDACDTDNDNDGAFDGYELGWNGGGANATDPAVVDSDGDGITDGAEMFMLNGGDSNFDPKNAAKKGLPTSFNSTVQAYYRGCHLNLTLAAAYHPAFDGYSVTTFTDANGTYGVEFDQDGDGIVCPTDIDNDNGRGLGLGAATKKEVTDAVEAFGYNTALSRTDTDGDGCDDWVEIHDLNGDRKVSIGDLNALAKRGAGIIPGDDPVSEKIFDVNKDGKISIGDQNQIAQNSCGQKAWGGCPVCPVRP